MKINDLVKKQKEYFNSLETLSYEFRKNALLSLRKAIISNQLEIEEALFKDLGKSKVESYMAEIGIVLKEISFMLKHLRKFMKQKRVRTSLTDFPAKTKIMPYPYGVVLIMSPWNYPVNLTLSPLVGVIASGNTCILKPSEYSENTSKLISKMIKSIFPEKYISVVTGDKNTSQTLLDQNFDYIFFTGSKNVGKIVMEKASKNLTPVSLELGGKSPCIIDESASLKVAARRIVLGKLLNSGQTCIAPDYIFIHHSIKEKFVEYFKEALIEQYGNNPLKNQNLCKIINQKHYNRLRELINDQNIIIGGEYDDKLLKIAPTVIDNVTYTNKIMEDEIFGPILPILVYNDIEDVIRYINNNPSPLALYLFTNQKKIEKKILNSCNFGGGCINDVIVHFANENLPFGGVGESGMGAYHGKASFDTFTHYRSMIKKSNKIDIIFRYAPYTKFKEKIIKWFLK